MVCVSFCTDCKSDLIYRMGAHWPSQERRTPDRETRVRSSAGSVCCFLEQETFTPQKVLVIPRNRWLRLNMTKKLFTGTLNHNQNKTNNLSHSRNSTLKIVQCDLNSIQNYAMWFAVLKVVLFNVHFLNCF